MGEKEIQVEIARRTLVDCWQSFSQGIGCGWGTERKQELGHPGAKCPEIVWATLPQRILEASPHLQGYDAADLPWDEIERLKRERGWNVIEALDYLGL
jgi:hypothetical protein